MQNYVTRDMNFLRLLGCGLFVLGDFWGFWLRMLCVIMVPVVLIGHWGQVFLREYMNGSDNIAAGVFLFIGFQIFKFFLGILSAGCFYQGLIAILHEKTPSVVGSIQSLTGKWWPLIWTDFLRTLYVTLGFFCLVIPGIILAFRYAFVLPVLFEEDQHGADALRRSRDLMQGQYGMAFCFCLAGLLFGDVGVGLILYVKNWAFMSFLVIPLFVLLQVWFGGAWMILYLSIRERERMQEERMERRQAQLRMKDMAGMESIPS